MGDVVFVMVLLVGYCFVAILAIVMVVAPITGAFIGIAVGAERIAKTRQWESFKGFIGASWQTVRQLPQLRHRLQLRFREFRGEESQ